ncbi:MAG: hypothetical protein V4699_02260 [Patescibacteria group bacterium]
MKILIFGESEVDFNAMIKTQFRAYDDTITFSSMYYTAFRCVLGEGWDMVIISPKIQFGHCILIVASINGAQTGVLDGHRIRYFELPKEGGDLLKYLTSIN